MQLLFCLLQETQLCKCKSYGVRSFFRGDTFATVVLTLIHFNIAEIQTDRLSVRESYDLVFWEDSVTKIK
jgi:hypothetical protein